MSIWPLPDVVQVILIYLLLLGLLRIPVILDMVGSEKDSSNQQEKDGQY